MDSQNQQKVKPSLILTEEAYITTNTQILKRRLREVGIDPDVGLETNYKHFGDQLCIEITEKSKEKDAE